MRRLIFFLSLFLFFGGSSRNCNAADLDELKHRRQLAAKEYSDGILLLHTESRFALPADGYRENPAFYYLTGHENIPGAIFALDGKSGECWLFLGSEKDFSLLSDGDGLVPGAEAQKKLGIDHVVEWAQLEAFLSSHSPAAAKVYYVRDEPQLPGNLSATKDNRAPAWIQVLQHTWPAVNFQPAGEALSLLMAVQSPFEQERTRAAAQATTKAFLVGMSAIHPGASQRSVELAVVNSCWQAGAHGVSFWPWAMAGANGVFPKPFTSLARYDHLNTEMNDGDLVRLDVGCEVEHYQGDLGRTVPVSGHYTEEQREVWNLFVAAYQAAAKELKAGATADHIFDVWKGELQRHRASVKTQLAKEAIDSWSEHKNVPYWQIHTMNLDAGPIGPALKAGMTVDFEPIASIGGQGYYMEDMFLIMDTGAEVLTPGLPYTAEEIEAKMAGGAPTKIKKK
jgi:Xaa-Pro aminopeptidase